MPDAEGVKFTLGSGWKGRESVRLLDRSQPVAAAGQHLVRIGLVPDIPDQPVLWSLEHIVQCNRQLDRAQACGKVASLAADCLDQVATQLFGDLRQVATRQRTQVGGRLYF